VRGDCEDHLVGALECKERAVGEVRACCNVTSRTTNQRDSRDIATCSLTYGRRSKWSFCYGSSEAARRGAAMRERKLGARES
jgi:hypothetical protein